MAENMELINKRVEAIKPGTSKFKYYTETPLSELKDKTERLIKKGLEEKYFQTLSENKEVAPVMQPLTEDAPGAEHEEEEKKNGSWKDLATGAAVGAAAGAAGAAIAFPDIVTHCKEWLDDCRFKFKAWWNNTDVKTVQRVMDNTGKTEDQAIADISAQNARAASGGNIGDIEDAEHAEGGTQSWFQTNITGPVGDAFENVTKFFENQIDKLFGEGTGAEHHTAVQWGVGIFAAVLVVLVVYAVWKLIKRFVRDDGDVKSEGEDISESVEQNVALAVISEAETEFANGANGLTGLRAIMKRYADGLINKLLDDPKFIKYMGKENNDLLNDLKDYQKANGALSESKTDAQYYEQYKALYEEEDAELNDSAEESEGMISKIATTFGDATNNVAGKIKDIYNRIANHPNRLVRWIPPAVVAALTVLAIGHYWNKNIQPDTTPWKGAGKKVMDDVNSKVAPDMVIPEKLKITGSGDLKPWNTDSMASPDMQVNAPTKITNGSWSTTSESNSSNFSLFMRSLGGMDFITEAMTKCKNCDALDNLSGKGEKLADNIIERAKYVATDLINDKEFITFSKQQNPEMLKAVKKFATCTKGAKKVNPSASKKGKK